MLCGRHGDRRRRFEDQTDRLRPASGSCLLEDAGDLHFDGVEGYAMFLGDSGIGPAVDQMPANSGLGRRQTVGFGGPRRREGAVIQGGNPSLRTAPHFVCDIRIQILPWIDILIINIEV